MAVSDIDFYSDYKGIGSQKDLYTNGEDRKIWATTGTIKRGIEETARGMETCYEDEETEKGRIGWK